MLLALTTETELNSNCYAVSVPIEDWKIPQYSSLVYRSGSNEHHVASKENERQTINPELRDLLIAQGKSPCDAEVLLKKGVCVNVQFVKSH